MLLTKTANGAHQRATAARPRLRRLAGAKLPTMDRRAFLKRSGLVAGAGAFASQLPFELIGKAGAAVVFASGFGEAGAEGKEMQQRLAETARAGKLALLGPNCLGIQVPGAKLDASFAARMSQPGDLALISQSGAIAAGMVEWAARRNLAIHLAAVVPFSLFHTLGLWLLRQLWFAGVLGEAYSLPLTPERFGFEFAKDIFNYGLLSAGVLAMRHFFSRREQEPAAVPVASPVVLTIATPAEVLCQVKVTAPGW